MPSMLHEVFIELFREGETMAAQLLVDVLKVDLPPYATIRKGETDLTQIVPTEYRADLVQVLYDDDGRPVFAIVIEPQLHVDKRKRFSWPLYGTAMWAKLECPTVVLVVTSNPSVATWAAKPIVHGPGSLFQPLVLGPLDIPWVTAVEEARQLPELAVLSALAHGNQPSGHKVVLAAIVAISEMDLDRATLYYDLVLSSLNEAARKGLEAMMMDGNYEYQSDFAKKYVAEGRQEGRVDVLQKLLAQKFGDLPATLVARLRCGSGEELDRWVGRVILAQSLDEVFGDA